MRSPAHLANILILFGILLAPQFARAKGESPAAQIEKQLGTSILEAKSDDLAKAIARCVEQNPNRSDKYAAAALKSGRADANAIAPNLVVASIQGLGKDLTESRLSGIIYESVKVTPDAVLKVVDASCREVPGKLAPAIVRASILAVPDPYKMVEAVPKKVPNAGTSTLPTTTEANDFKGGDSFKGDFKTVRRTPKDEPEPGTQTLGEAIVQTAINASGVQDPSEIIAAATLPPLGDSTHPPEPHGDGIPTILNEPHPPVVSQ